MQAVLTCLRVQFVSSFLLYYSCEVVQATLSQSVCPWKPLSHYTNGTWKFLVCLDGLHNSSKCWLGWFLDRNAWKSMWARKKYSKGIKVLWKRLIIRILKSMWMLSDKNGSIIPTVGTLLLKYCSVLIHYLRFVHYDLWRLCASDVTGLGTRRLPPLGHLRACSEYPPAGRGTWGRCRREKQQGNKIHTY